MLHPFKYSVHRALATPFALLLVLANSLEAQGCGVRSAYQMGNATAVSNIVQVDTGWQPGPVTTFQQNGGGSPGSSLYSVGTVQTRAHFGRLRIQGTGQAQNWNGNGTSLYLIPPAFDTPTVQFRDTFTVQAQGLPVGTPVQIEARVRMVGSCVVTGLWPVLSTYGAEIRVAPFANALGMGSIVTSLNATNGVATAIVQTTVGATFTVEGRMTSSVDEHGVRNGLPAAASYSIDLESRFEFRSVTAGAWIATCSGTTYPSAQATSQAVGSGCGSGPPTLTSTLPLLGSSLSLTTNGAAAGAPVFRGLAIGAPVATPFGTCVLQLDPATLVLEFAGVADAAGQHTAAVPLPNALGFAGLALTAQSLVLGTGGPFLGLGELSNAVALVVGF
ncbi:MAG: hypothetical protein JNK49_01970 [Planctomycetes bacterium]|nr:hypothetical protein [Planctomycetota bacterium]